MASLFEDRLRLTTVAPWAIAHSSPAAKIVPLPRLSGPRTRIEMMSAPGARLWMIPAHAVPWPTTSIASASSTHLRVVLARLDPDAPDELAADRRVIALDARVDDRHGDPGPVGSAEGHVTVHPGDGHEPLEPLATLADEGLAPGGQVGIGQWSDERADGPRPRRRARLSRSAWRATAPSRSVTSSSRSGSAPRIRATCSTSSQRRLSSSRPRRSVPARTSSSSAVSEARARRPRLVGQGGPEEGRDVALDAARPDRDGGLPGEHAGQLDVAQGEGGLAPLVEDLEHADRALVVDERDGDDRARHVGRPLGELRARSARRSPRPRWRGPGRS